MLITKDNRGRIIGLRETYFSKDESVEVSVHRNVSTITTRDRNTGKVDSKTFFGRTPVPSDFDEKKRITGSGAFSALPVTGRDWVYRRLDWLPETPRSSFLNGFW